MSTTVAFLPQAANLSISASTASASATWSGTDVLADSIAVYNPAATGKFAFVRVGKGAQTAVIGDFAVAPGTVRVIRCKPNDDTVAVILDAAGVSGPVYFQRGEGWS